MNMKNFVNITWLYVQNMHLSPTSWNYGQSPSLPLQEWSWTPVEPGAQWLSARRCAVCSQALRASPLLCAAQPVTPSSAPAAEAPGRTATPAPSASPWCHPHPLMKAGQSVSCSVSCPPPAATVWTLKMILCVLKAGLVCEADWGWTQWTPFTAANGIQVTECWWP